MAAGDLRPSGIHIAGSDGAALLLKSMERMRQNLRGTVVHVGDPADELSSATHEMSALMLSSYSLDREFGDGH